MESLTLIPSMKIWR